MIILKPFFVGFMLMMLVPISYIVTAAYLGATLFDTSSRFPKWNAETSNHNIKPTRASALLRQERVITFAANAANLSPDMKERLNSLTDLFHVHGHVQGVRVIGYADPVGNAGYNQALSEKRAENVAHYIIATARGNITAQLIDTRWRGAEHVATVCLDHQDISGDCLRKERRVEVEVDYIPDQEASR